MANDIGVWLGGKLRDARQAAGYSSQDSLARDLGFDRTTINKVETGERAPSEEVAAKLAERFPELCGGLYTEIAEVVRASRSSASKYPGWFGKVWVPVERDATALRTWEPIIVPGLLQTSDYAMALFRAWNPSASDDELDELVKGRLERQAILDRDSPPYLRVVLDEMVLHRLVGSPKIMHEQLVHLADMSCRPDLVIQVVPAGLGAHGGLLGPLILAEPSGNVYLETAVDAQITGDEAVKEQAALIFERLTEDALPRGASRDLIVKVANQKWNEQTD